MKLLYIFLSHLLIVANGYNFNCSTSDLPKGKHFGNRPWPNGIVKYELHSSLTSQDRIEVQKAFDIYHKKTCIRFQAKSAQETAYVSIQNDPNTCGIAHLCRSGGWQYAKFGGSCRNVETMVHELGHTLCYGHEQDRVDRDDYIQFPSGCGVPGIDYFNTMGLLYDYKSSMHYGCDNCMLPKLAGVGIRDCGQDNLSVLDVEKINAFYNCPGCQSYRFKNIRQLTSTDRANLVPGGTYWDGLKLYICRAYYQGDIIVGTTNAQDGYCYVSWGGKEHRMTNGEALTYGNAGSRITWRQKASNNVIPATAIPGGRTHDGHTIYIGRCIMQSGSRTATVIGKIVSYWPDAIFIPLDGREYKCNNFEILNCI